MTVTGIGGFFFRARDPGALRGWYRTHLGVGGEGYDPWRQAAGPTMFLPFGSSTDYWPADKPWLLNLRVDNLDAVLARLNAAGIAVTTDPAWDSPEAGRFARIHDPESNPIELWEPPVPV
ncbi:VOC family protein [Sphingomonas sp. BAUL-RG-20F-R05-02]|uniref:VOC family protein n=1 Tax=Sphingomonas sp. BAUL-RG-20F-R05-02 TaxID=2914830 RepID=UPI001F56DD51|nr:VOC family protein [Sphingomonas sp. BAUL-RG-20F-R05-02]